MAAHHVVGDLDTLEEHHIEQRIGDHPEGDKVKAARLFAIGAPVGHVVSSINDCFDGWLEEGADNLADLRLAFAGKLSHALSKRWLVGVRQQTLQGLVMLGVNAGECRLSGIDRLLVGLVGVEPTVQRFQRLRHKQKSRRCESWPRDEIGDSEADG